VFGAPRFDWLDAHPEDARLFQQAMISLSQGANEAVAEAFDFTPFNRIADVGGGHGQLLSVILARNRHLSGILSDRPSSIEAAKTGVGGPLLRTEFVAGDFFDAALRGVDIFVLKRVIHDWGDERAAAILCNCRAAMPPLGRVLVAERITVDGNDPDLNKYLDIFMLAITGGIERAEDQFAKLFAQAGLRLERVIPTGVGISVIEASPAS
jgi:O-methyltransferase domain